MQRLSSPGDAGVAQVVLVAVARDRQVVQHQCPVTVHPHRHRLFMEAAFAHLAAH